MYTRSTRFGLLTMTGIACLMLVASAAAQQITPEQYETLKYRHVGPVGNRFIAVAGIAGNPMVYYAGAASGGLWKTVDGGLTFAPVFDDQPVHSIGAVAVAPSDPEIVWAGTGETFIRSNVSIGNGVWKTTDGGETWRHAGLGAPGGSDGLSSIQRIPMSCMWRPSVMPTCPGRSAASTGPGTAGIPGSGRWP